VERTGPGDGASGHNGGIFSIGAVVPTATGSVLRSIPHMVSTGRIRAKNVVVAAGAWSHHLTRMLGDRVLLETERGYGMTVTDPATRAENVYYAFGHGHTGFTVAAVTGRLVTSMIAGETAASIWSRSTSGDLLAGAGRAPEGERVGTRRCRTDACRSESPSKISQPRSRSNNGYHSRRP